MPSKKEKVKEKVNVELYPYDDFSFIDDEEAFRELCSTLNFDAFDDSITSEDILRRKREINLQNGEFVRNNQSYAQPQNSFNNNLNNNTGGNYVYGAFPTSLPPGSYYPYPGPPMQNFFNANINNPNFDNNPSSNNFNNQQYSNSINNFYYPMQYSEPTQNVNPPQYPLQTPYHVPLSMSISNSDTMTVSSSSSDHMSISSSLSIDPNNVSFSMNNSSNNNVMTNTINVQSNNSSHDNTPRTHIPASQQQQQSQQQQSQQQSQQHQQYNPHKVRKIVRSLIPSDDVRRKYASLFSEAFNGTGIEELRVLLHLYALPSCVAIYKYVGNPNPLYGPQYCELKGVEAIMNYWQAIFGAVPDSVFEMQENKLRVLANPAHIQHIENNMNRNNNNSSSTSHPNSNSENNAAPVAIVMKFIFSGTKVYRISADNHANVVYSDTTTTSTSTTASNPPVGSNNSNPADHNHSDTTVHHNHRDTGTSGDSATQQSLLNPDVSADESTTTISTSEEPIIQKLTHQLGLDGCLEKSAPFIFLGTMTFFTGSDKKIYKIEVVYCVRS